MKSEADFRAEYQKYKKDINKAIIRVLNSGRYILGKEVERFERKFAAFTGTKYAVGVGSGFDALYISLSSLLIKEPRVYLHKPLHISTYNALILSNCIHVDSLDDADIVIPTISPENGNFDAGNFDGIIIEDACQSVGMKRVIDDNVTASCYSFHPLKKLHCYGDGGAIALNDRTLYKYIKQYRNHGRVDKTKIFSIGVNSRLDEIQAAVLNVMMDKLKGEI